MAKIDNSWHGGKGSDVTKRTNKDKFDKGYDQIDWSKKAEDSKSKKK